MEGKKITNKNDNFMMYIPKKKHEIWEEKNKKIYLIFKYDRWFYKIARWLVKKPFVSEIEFDDLGSSVWKLINGGNSVYDIGKELIHKYGDKCEPAYDRLILYLRYLNRRGWICFERGNQN